jgi:CheY-like chemotaxis protein
MAEADLLVVDDDPQIGQLLTAMLERKDFHVETAYVGFEGMEEVQASEPALVVPDIMISDMDDWETCRRKKAISDVPGLFLTVWSDVATFNRGQSYIVDTGESAVRFGIYLDANVLSDLAGEVEFLNYIEASTLPIVRY